MISCLNSNILGRLPEGSWTQAPQNPDAAQFISATGTTFSAQDTIQIKFALKQREFTHTFFVIRDLPCNVLLGNDFILNQKMIIDQRKGEVIFSPTKRGEKPLTVKLKNPSLKSQALIANTIVVPPLVATRIPLKVPEDQRKLMQKDVLVEPYAIDPCLVIMVTLSKTHRIQTTVLNISNEPITLREGDLFGTVETVKIQNKKNHFSPKSAFRPTTPETQENILKSPVVDGVIPEGIKFGEDLSSQQRKQLESLIMEFHDIFGEPTTHSTTTHVQHSINTGNAPPINQRAYRVSEKEKDVAKREIIKMLTLGIIRPSSSSWASPIVLVKKKDGTMRFCVDYRKLNAVTARDVYPLPRIEELLNYLKGKKFFSLCDAIYGFWQVPIVEGDVAKTAFTSSEGLYEFVVMPFGLTNAPATFQRLMDEVLQGIRYVCVLDYIDDLLTYSNTWEDHLQHLRMLFDRLRQSNIKLKPTKCSFGLSELVFLGYKISRTGIAPDPGKIKAVEFFPTPRDVTGVKSFTGLCNYYRKFVKDFARIAQPINDLTRSSVPFVWGEAQNQAFKTLKEKLTSAPVLMLPDNTKPFILHTDASNSALGAVLEQLDEKGEQRVVAYLSRALNDAEKNYSTTERECLAIVWATKVLRPYLYGQEFTVITDHHSLVWLMTYKDSSARLLRWSLQLQEYNFKINYRPGSQHQNVDSLSRNPVMITQADATTAQAQRQDKSLQYVFKDAARPQSVFLLRDEVLFKKTKRKSPEGNITFKDVLVLPTKCREEAIAMCHDDPFTGAHLGEKKATAKLADRFWWPHMRKEFKHWIESCPACIIRKPTTTQQVGKLSSIPVFAPFELVGIDILGPLPLSDDGNKWIVVFTDHFTKWAEAFPIANHDAKTIADLLVKNVMCRFGCPKKLVSDQGKEFMSQLVKGVLKSMGVEQLRTTPYHPQTDGHTERMNRTLIGMLAAYINEDQTNWDRVLPFVLFAYRSSVHASTNYTPFYLLHGVDARFPVDVDITPELTSPPPVQDYIARISKELQTAYRIVRDNIQHAQQQQATWYNKKAKPAPVYEVGSLVMQFVLKKDSGLLKKTKKFQHKWQGPYEVVAKITELSYKIRDPSTRKKPWVVHVARLKPYVSYLGRKNFVEDFNILDDEQEDDLRGDASHIANLPSAEPRLPSVSSVADPKAVKVRRPLVPSVADPKVTRPQRSVVPLSPALVSSDADHRVQAPTLVSSDADHRVAIPTSVSSDADHEVEVPTLESSVADHGVAITPLVSSVADHGVSTSSLESSVADHRVSGPSSVSSVADHEGVELRKPKSFVAKHGPVAKSLRRSLSFDAKHGSPAKQTDTVGNLKRKHQQQLAKVKSIKTPVSAKTSWSLSSLNNTQVSTLSGINRVFDVSKVIDHDWRLSHIVDVAILGPPRRQENYYLVAWQDQSEGDQRWLNYDQLHLYEGANKIERAWDAQLQRLQKAKNRL